MAYTALYRKWRPKRFEDVRGQEHIVRTLKNQMNSDRVGHAYLFTGTRGTGKTTVAKIFARAVNCEHPVNGSPCNECPTCRSILSGASVNVVEIDAASNNGVDNIREIREEVKYKPTEGNYRVYIIDEVHMLSAGAFNALLKTLEEPPEYVIFILATTEVHKIPITVLSRCQRYDFRRLTLDTLKEQIRDLLTAENVSFEDSAVNYIARAADGSSRDALSLLEQCVSYFYGETLTYEKVLEVLGAVDQEVYSRILLGIRKYQVAEVMGIVDEILSTGRDLSQFVLDLTWYLRNILLLQSENPGEEVLGISKDNLIRMQKEAEDLDIDCVMRYIRILSELSNQLRYAVSKRVLLEVALIRMMQPSMEDDLESLRERVRALEGNGVPAVQQIPASRPEVRQEAPVQKVQKTIEVTQADFEDIQMLKKDWNDIIGSSTELLHSILLGTTVSAGEQEGSILVLFRNEFYCTIASERGREKVLEDLLLARYQKRFKVGFRALQKNEDVPVLVPGKRIPGISMDIEESE